MPLWTTQEIFSEVIRRCSAGERVGLCTVVSTRGSCPQDAGAKMIVTADGRTLGTLGGGCVEAEVRKQASQMLLDDRTGLLQFSLDHDYGWDDGLICGGVMDVLVQSLDRSRLDLFSRTIASIEKGEGTEIRLAYVTPKDNKHCEYIERIEPPPTLLIIGAGHVAQALASIAPGIGFDVSVIDDRPDYVSAERFPSAKNRITGEIESELAKFPIDAGTYIVIVTRGHQHDGAALAGVVNSSAKYIGMIGSKRKVKAIFDGLVADGVAMEKLLRVHAPIGYDIGAVSVPEIAVSIASELIAVRRNAKKDVAAKPMKIDEGTIKSWLERGC